MVRRIGPAYFALFASLYAIQGIVISYFFNFNQGYMEVAGVSDKGIASARSLALLPLVLRFLGGPLSDRFNLFGLGHRRPFIVIGLVLQGAGLLGLSLVNPASKLTLFTILAVLTVLGLALYDTATDGLILDSTTAEDRPRLQGAFMTARFAGAMISSIGFGLWLNRTGNGPGHGDGPIWACVGLSLIPLFLQVWLREPPKQGPADEFQWASLRVLVRPTSLLLLAFGTLYAIVAYAVEINLSQYYETLGFDQGAVGVLAAFRYAGRAIGALILGLSSRRLGRGWILAIGVVGLALATLAQSAVGNGTWAAITAFGFGLANGWNDALFYVLAMEASDPRMLASTCALFMSVTNLSVTGGYFFALGVARFQGNYRPVFVIASILVLAALPLALPLRGRQDRDRSVDSRSSVS